MLLNSVIIVLREVLEAALLVSVFLASAKFLQIKNNWVRISIALGAVGAIAYGVSIQGVSELFDGVGQEVCNAALQLAAFCGLLAIIFLIPRRIGSLQHPRTAIPALMAITVALAAAREGSEILVYVSGFWSMSNFFSAIGIGSLIGACIGCSVGVLIYYLLLAQPSQRAVPTTLVLLGLIAAGMSSQATRLLIQADWVPAAGALWDTSGVLSEQSLPGQLLYALVGYEATPTATEVIVYLASIALLIVAFLAGRYSANIHAEATA
jgi:high-affinity iron transporter